MHVLLVIENGSGRCGCFTDAAPFCYEPVAYGFELADESRPGHGLACAGHALRLRTDGLVRRMWTCSPSMV